MRNLTVKHTCTNNEQKSGVVIRGGLDRTNCTNNEQKSGVVYRKTCKTILSLFYISMYTIRLTSHGEFRDRKLLTCLFLSAKLVAILHRGLNLFYIDMLRVI